MPTRIEEFEELTQQLTKQADAMKEFSRRGPGVAVDVCAIWKVAKPFIEIAIKVLRLLPFKWGKVAADGLQILDDEMTKICP